LADRIDEYFFQQLKNFNEYKLVFITKENYEIDEIEDKKQHLKHVKTSLKKFYESTKVSL
jgi:HSP90 family molecular chaperone